MEFISDLLLKAGKGILNIMSDVFKDYIGHVIDGLKFANTKDVLASFDDLHIENITLLMCNFSLDPHESRRGQMAGQNGKMNSALPSPTQRPVLWILFPVIE